MFCHPVDRSMGLKKTGSLLGKPLDLAGLQCLDVLVGLNTNWFTICPTAEKIKQNRCNKGDIL